jgi:hypothetical protein
MKVLDYNQAQSGFVKTHQPCPCGQHKGCYSERENGSGYCHSCGKNHPSSNLATTYTYQPAPQPIQLAIEPQIVSDAEIHLSLFDIPTSRFCALCEQVTGRKPQSLYYLGAYGNDVIFWYRDFMRVVRNAKRINYSENGFNRNKSVNPYMMYNSANSFITPFWGEEHLQTFLTTNLTDIFIVESEKTAIYAQCSSQFRWALWLACGGASLCTVSKIERVKHLLSEKRVFVLFDKDSGGESSTAPALQNFKRAGVSASALFTADLYPNAPQGCDLADAILAASGVQV